MPKQNPQRYPCSLSPINSASRTFVPDPPFPKRSSSGASSRATTDAPSQTTRTDLTLHAKSKTSPKKRKPPSLFTQRQQTRFRDPGVIRRHLVLHARATQLPPRCRSEGGREGSGRTPTRQILPFHLTLIALPNCTPFRLLYLGDSK